MYVYYKAAAAPSAPRGRGEVLAHLEGASTFRDRDFLLKKGAQLRR